MDLKVAPSILAANFLDLEKEVIEIGNSGADSLHIDIMDGSFVPPISFGQEITKKISSISLIPLDVHLMVNNPENHYESFIAAGAKNITFHVESTAHSHLLAQEIALRGVSVGVALNPATPLSSIEYLLPIVNLVLVMTVNPGWGGQKFIPEMLNKIKQLKSILPKNRTIDIQVDGGVNQNTAKDCINAGATNLVAGTYVFSSKDYAASILSLKNN
jgi:ribulose-phosphate 3-epimerase